MDIGEWMAIAVTSKTKKVEVEKSIDGKRYIARKGDNSTVVFRVPEEEYDKAYIEALAINSKLEYESKRLDDEIYNIKTEVGVNMLFDGKVTESIKRANEEPSSYKRKVQEKAKKRAKKRNIKNKPKTNTKKKWFIRIGMGLSIAAIAAGIWIAKHQKGEKVEQNYVTPTGVTEKGEAPSLTDINSNTAVLDNEIDTYDEVIKDLKQRYVEAYNEKFGTDLKSNEIAIYINDIEGGIVFEVDEKKVTKGSNPFETETYLEQKYGEEVTEVGGCNKVLQFVKQREGSDIQEVLDTYNVSNGEKIYSGNDLAGLDKEGLTLEELGINKKVLEKGAAAIESPSIEGVAGSLEERIEDYNEAVQDMER